jgi:hypothetical protein
LNNFPNFYERFESSLAELMDNVFAHSGSTVGGFLDTYHDSETGELRFALGDLGITIPGHLRSRISEYGDYNDRAVLIEAFKEGVSGDRETRFGSGLPYVKDVTTQVGGSLEVYSGLAYFSKTFDSETVVEPRVPFPGTLIYIRWPSR